MANSKSVGDKLRVRASGLAFDEHHAAPSGRVSLAPKLFLKPNESGTTNSKYLFPSIDKMMHSS